MCTYGLMKHKSVNISKSMRTTPKQTSFCCLSSLLVTSYKPQLSNAGGKIEWGHLAAGDSNLRAAFETRQGQHYDMVEEDPDLRPAPLSGAGPSGANMAPLGRGQDATKPAWMTHPEGPAAPGSAGAFDMIFRVGVPCWCLVQFKNL